MKLDIVRLLDLRRCKYSAPWRSESPVAKRMFTLTPSQLRSIIHQHFKNPGAVYKAYCKGKVPSPLKLRHGLVIYHEPNDDVESTFYEIFVRKCYTPRGFYRPERRHIVLDLGANIGLFALYLSWRTPGIRIHCFEPSVQAAARLSQNINANALADFVRIHPFAISDEPGPRELLNSRYTTCSSFFNSRESRGVTVNCITLAQALQECDVHMVDFLKMDVEGAEDEIVESTDPAVWKRIRKLIMECHSDTRPNCVARIGRTLKANGFSVSIDDAAPYGDHMCILRATQA